MSGAILHLYHTPVAFEGTIKAVDGATPSGVLDLVITEENPSGAKDSQTITIPVFVQADNILTL